MSDPIVDHLERFDGWITIIGRFHKARQKRVALAFEDECERLGAPFVVLGDRDPATLPDRSVPLIIMNIATHGVRQVCAQYGLLPGELPIAIMSGKGMSGRRAQLEPGDAKTAFATLAAQLIRGGVELPMDVLQKIADEIPSPPSTEVH